MAEEDDFEEIAEPDDPDVVDLEALEDDDILEDDALDDDLDDDVDVVVDVVEEEEEGAVEAVATPAADDDDDDDEDEDVLDPDDVEAGLDVILKDRLVAVDEDDEDDEEETPDTDDRGDGLTKVLLKRPGEFVCQSCFLLKHPGQLADATRMLCRDCV
jgi:hypothetical protein